MGFSAGGSVAVNAALTHTPDCRPDFVAAIYTADYNADPVPADAAPLFILCTANDEMASTNSLRLYAEWRSAGHPVESKTGDIIHHVQRICNVAERAFLDQAISLYLPLPK